MIIIHVAIFLILNNFLNNGENFNYFLRLSFLFCQLIFKKKKALARKFKFLAFQKISSQDFRRKSLKCHEFVESIFRATIIFNAQFLFTCVLNVFKKQIRVQGRIFHFPRKVIFRFISYQISSSEIIKNDYSN